VTTALEDLSAAMERLEGATYDSTRAQQKAAEAVSNVPRWWRENLERFNAASTGGSGHDGPRCPACRGPLGYSSVCATCTASRV
jgi:hypothetical protein